MATDVDQILRGPDAYSIAYKAIELMERHSAWPTAVNFELWIHYVADPEGPLARELTRLIATGEAITDSVSVDLATAYLPKAKASEQIRDAGDQLSKELAEVSIAVQAAQKSTSIYGATLEGASKRLNAQVDPTVLQTMVQSLAAATRRIQKENKSLEDRLGASKAEVTRLREHLEQVRREATTDGLTQLANRRAFDDALERACRDADTQGGDFTIAVLDIDHFKSFNDTWGHQTGDQVLRYVASVIGRLGSAPRFAARFGGEEFAMLFPNETAKSVLRSLEEIRQEVASRALKRRSTNEDLGTVTISSGFTVRQAGEPSNVALERADAALYASKRAGRNRVTNADMVSNAA